VERITEIFGPCDKKALRSAWARPEDDTDSRKRARHGENNLQQLMSATNSFGVGCHSLSAILMRDLQ